MATGWAVEVRLQYLDGGWSPPQIWYADTADQLEAERIVKDRLEISDDIKIEAKAEISASAIARLKSHWGLKDSDAVQWI